MIFHEHAAAAAQLIDQIRVEVLAELRTGGAAGVRHLLPDARPRRFDRAGVHVFFFHFLECFFQKVFGHPDLLPSASPSRLAAGSRIRWSLTATLFFSNLNIPASSSIVSPST